MKLLKYWYVLIPFALGLTAGFILTYPSISNPVYYLRADLGILLILLGLALSTVLALVILVRSQLEAIDQTAREEAARDRRRFLSLLDHELKNPLTAIMAGLANLTADHQSATLESVESQVQRLSRLVADLRKLSDLETRPIDMGMVNLPELLELSLIHISEPTRPY